MTRQHTLASSISTFGLGLHTGERIRLSLRPADEGTGIVFRRTDKAGSPDIPARLSQVVDARLATTLGVGDVSVATVEHVLAALWGEGIDNAIVEVDGPEVPAGDGSAAPWVTLVREAGARGQRDARMYLCVRKLVQVEEGDRRAAIAPSDVFSVHCEIEFNHPIIRRQGLCMPVDGQVFRTQIAPARTFGFLHEVEAIKARGLAKGGSFENVVVVDSDRILNPEGLRFPDEFVRHKVLDAIGDLYLLGGPLIGALSLHKSGHVVHHALARAIVETPGAFEWVPSHDIAPEVRRRSQPPAAAFAAAGG